jgi:hypothetical protein
MTHRGKVKWQVIKGSLEVGRYPVEGQLKASCNTNWVLVNSDWRINKQNSKIIQNHPLF